MDLKVPSILFVVLIMLIAEKGRAWDVDFSHHQSQEKFTAPPRKNSDDNASADGSGQSSAEYVKTIHTHKNFPRQEIVILNTEKGFVPSNVPLHKGEHYTIHVVNVNESKKNLSFILDAFDEHHATYYGQIKTFELDPDREGVYQYECPETTTMGKVVVFGPNKMSPPAMPGNKDVHRTISSQ